MASDGDLDLDLIGTRLAICRLAADMGLPDWVALDTPGPVSVTRTADELSLVLPQDRVPAGVPAERGWRAMAVRGPLDFSLVGILSRLTAPLARAGVPVFALSTHDTDWLLVREPDLEAAVAALDAAGHRVHTATSRLRRSTMTSPTARRYAAFTHDPDGGNPAGVVITDELPDEAVMQQVASDVGFSETAFVAPRDRGVGQYDVRYFSPAAEVPFCGHATIATGVALADDDPELEHVVLHSRTDEIPVAVSRVGGLTTATLTSPSTSHTTPSDELLEESLAGFGWDRSVLADDLAPVVASAGADHLVLPLASRELLAAMDYDFDAVQALMQREGWTTIDLVWRESPTRFHARNAFAVGGVVEDPATGAAAAALGGYLRDSDVLAPPFTLTILQGHDMGRPSTLTVDASPDAPGIDVTGSAVPIPD